MTALTKELAQKLIDEQGLNVILPGTYTSIGDYALFGCNLEYLFIPESVTSIGYRAFDNNP